MINWLKKLMAILIKNRLKNSIECVVLKTYLVDGLFIKNERIQSLYIL
jgi:hypothetical protein